MENISTISLAVENSIKEIRHYLDEDKEQEDEYVAIVGEGETFFPFIYKVYIL